MAKQTIFSHFSPRTLIAFTLVFLLLLWAEGADVLSNITRPVVISLFRLLGIAAEDQGTRLNISGLSVPWTRDCAGLNFMALLPALVIWLHRNAASTRRYLLRILASLPAAFLANLCRILTLILYRKLFYPRVESPAFHYFIGFLWLFPFLFLVMGRRPGRGDPPLLETFYWACSLSILAPFVTSPSGTLVAASAMLLLAQNKLRPLHRAIVPSLLWLGAASVIAWTHMESLWSPWMLMCPLFADLRLWRQPERLLLLAGTVPLFSMQSWSLPILFVAAGVHLYRLLRLPAALKAPASPPATPAAILCTLALPLPFLISIVPLSPVPVIPPPPGVMSSQIDAQTHLIRLIGQPAHLYAVWYGPFGHGRHHTLPVCMRFRGVDLIPNRIQSGVYNDDHFWMRESFLVNDRALDYPRYVLWTFLPFSSPGVHIIYSAPKNSTNPAQFARDTDLLTQRLLQLTRQP